MTWRCDWMRDRQGSVTVLVFAFASSLVSRCRVCLFSRLFDWTTGHDFFPFSFLWLFFFFKGKIDFLGCVWLFKVEQHDSVLSLQKHCFNECVSMSVCVYVYVCSSMPRWIVRLLMLFRWCSLSRLVPRGSAILQLAWVCTMAEVGHQYSLCWFFDTLPSSLSIEGV